MGTVLVFWKNTKFIGQILCCPDVSAGHFEKLFQALDIRPYLASLHKLMYKPIPLIAVAAYCGKSYTPASSTGT